MRTNVNLSGKPCFVRRLKLPLSLALILMLSTVLPSVSAQPILTLSASNIVSSYFHTDDLQGLGDKVLKEALSRIGYGLKVVVLPGERSLMMADSGKVDGELLRTRGIEQRYPDLIRVPETFVDIEFMVFSLQSANEIKDWESLKGKSVAAIVSMKIVDEYIPESTLVTKVKNVNQLFGLLKKGRVEYVIFFRDMGMDFIKKHGLTGISASRSPLSKVPTYTYLNKKHHQLATKLAQSLREIKNDGTFQAIVDNHKL